MASRVEDKLEERRGGSVVEREGAAVMIADVAEQLTLRCAAVSCVSCL